MIIKKFRIGLILIEFLAHLLPWMALFMLNYLFVRNYEIVYDFNFHLFTWLIYLAIFYLNYYILMPTLLFRNRFLLYAGAALLSLTVSGYLKNRLDFNEIKARIESENFVSPRLRDRKNDMPPYLLPRDKKPLNMAPDDMRKKNDMPPGIRKHPPIGKMRFFGFSGLLLVFLGSTSIRFIQKWRDDEKKHSEIEKENMMNELSFLKQQINPHFLFNSLNSIYSLSLSKSSHTTRAILKLSSILRYILYETDKNTVPLQRELEALENYIELQRMRLTNKVKVQYSLSGKPENFKIPPLLLIPFIENAFKYGADNQNESFIKIEIHLINNQLEFNVLNKIVKRTDSENDLSEGGIGIKNIKRRLELIYPNDYILKCEDNKGIYSVFLKLKLKK